MRTFYPVLATLMVIVTAYFTYMIINVLVTMIKAKRKDHSLKICLTTAGKAFYIIITILYILLVIGGAAFGIHSALNGSNLYLNGISTVALASLLYAFQIANIVLSLFYWRCPHCQQYLPLKHAGKISHCPHCHKPIK